MEYSTRFKDPYFSTAKSWAKERRSRKYSARRDVCKSTPNGETLRREGYMKICNYGDMEIQCSGGVNPIEKFLNIQNPNQTDIQSNLSSILNHSNPTSISYKRWNHRDPLNDYGGRGYRWCIYYRYSAQQQYEQFQHNLQREKALKKHGKEYVQKKILRPKHWKKLKRRKEYKPPTVDEAAVHHKKVDVVFDDKLQREYLQYDLGRNQWITAFSTKFEWRGELTHGVGDYKLYVAFDDVERDRKFYKIDDDDDDDKGRAKKVKSKGSKRTNSSNNPTTTRQRRKRERKQMMKEIKTKKMRDKLKWEYVGCFDGSMKGFWFDQEMYFCVDIIHLINHTAYCDPKCGNSMKKNYAKNGKLTRWIKLVPCDPTDPLDKISAQCYGVGVDAYSQPIIPFKRSDFTVSGYTASDDDVVDGDDDDESHFEDGGYESKAKNIQISPRIQDEEISEGKGCRLVIHEQRPVLTFHRKIDGISPGYVSPDWAHWDTIRRKKEFHQTKKCMKKKFARLSVKDWDINGVPLF